MKTQTLFYNMIRIYLFAIKTLHSFGHVSTKLWLFTRKLQREPVISQVKIKPMLPFFWGGQITYQDFIVLYDSKQNIFGGLLFLKEAI